MPLIGVPLIFVSHGGTALAISLAEIGVILSISQADEVLNLILNMKILFTAGRNGRHFYPIIAVAEAINDLVRERKLLEPAALLRGARPYDREMLWPEHYSLCRPRPERCGSYFFYTQLF